MPPTAHAGTAPTPYEFSALSADLDLALNGTASTPGAGASSIDEWVWVLKARPTGSNAAITGGSTATPVLEGIDLPGTYLVWLRVRNNLGEWSAGNSAVDDGGEFPSAWVDMPGSILVIEAKTENAGLVIKAEGEHNYWDKDEAWFLEVDRLRGIYDDVVVPAAPRTMWVQAQAGDAAADGSMAKPFNPTSATAGGFTGPWQQAIAALQAIDITDVPGAPRTIIAAGTLDDLNTASSTAYDEDVSITADGPWSIVFTGLAVFAAGRKLTYITHGTLKAPPNLYIGGMGGLGVASSIAYVPTIELKDAAGSSWFMRWEGVAADSVVVLDSFAAGAFAYLRNCVLATVNVPNLAIRSADFCDFDTALTVKQINKAFRTRFDDVTVTTFVSDGGIVDCVFDASAVWTGPAGSALFDPITAERFEVAGGTYGSSASADDHLNISGRRIRAKGGLYTPSILDNGGSGNIDVITDGSLLVSTAARIDLAAAGDDGAGVGVRIISLAGDVLIETDGGVGSDIIFDSDDNILLWAEGAGATAIMLETFIGGIGIGSALGVDISAVDGDITIESLGSDNDIDIISNRHLSASFDASLTLNSTGTVAGLNVYTASETIELYADWDGGFGILDLYSDYQINLNADLYLAGGASQVALSAAQLHRVSADASFAATLVNSGGDASFPLPATSAWDAEDFLYITGTDNFNGLWGFSSGGKLREPYGSGLAAWNGSGDLAGTVESGTARVFGNVITHIESDHFIWLEAPAILVRGQMLARSGGATWDSSDDIDPDYMHRVVTAPAVDGTRFPYAGDGLVPNEVASVRMPPGFWTDSGVTLAGSADFECADNSNSKTWYFTIGGNVVATASGTTGTFQNKRWRHHFSVHKTDTSNQLSWYLFSQVVDLTTKSVNSGIDFGTVTETVSGEIEVGWEMLSDSNGDIAFLGWRTWVIADRDDAPIGVV